MIRTERNTSEIEAIRNLQICRVILSRTPMITGYGEFSKLASTLGQYIDNIEPKVTTSEISEINESEDCKLVARVLGLK